MSPFSCSKSWQCLYIYYYISCVFSIECVQKSVKGTSKYCVYLLGTTYKDFVKCSVCKISSHLGLFMLTFDFQKCFIKSLKPLHLSVTLFYIFNTSVSVSFLNRGQTIMFPAVYFSANMFACKSMIPPSLDTHQHTLSSLAITPVIFLISSF